jgi:hypothetical protein
VLKGQVSMGTELLQHPLRLLHQRAFQPLQHWNSLEQLAPPSDHQLQVFEPISTWTPSQQADTDSLEHLGGQVSCVCLMLGCSAGASHTLSGTHTRQGRHTLMWTVLRVHLDSCRYSRLKCPAHTRSTAVRSFAPLKPGCGLHHARLVLLQQARATIDAHLLETGALLLRNLPVTTPEACESFVRGLNYQHMAYEPGGGTTQEGAWCSKLSCYRCLALLLVVTCLADT